MDQTENAEEGQKDTATLDLVATVRTSRDGFIAIIEEAGKNRVYTTCTGDTIDKACAEALVAMQAAMSEIRVVQVAVRGMRVLIEGKK